MKRTSTYIATIPMKNVEQVIEVKKTLEQIFGWVVLRGRHSNRKNVLGDRWICGAQNDVPWRKAEYIDVYLHPENPNYESVNKRKGIKRMNLTSTKNEVVVLGCQGKGFYDEHLNKLRIKALFNESKQRKLRLEKYRNKARKLVEGDWGYITQSILDFVENNSNVTFTEMKTFYDVTLRGCPTIQKGGSFTHHLQALMNKGNAKNRRCGRLLMKQQLTGRYYVNKIV